MSEQKRRLQGALMGDKGYGRNAFRPTLNLALGGQHGYSPVLEEWISNQAYVRENLICVLLQAPRFFNLMNDPTTWVIALKALFELHAIKITGLNGTTEVETAGHKIGSTNEEQLEVVRTNRTRSEATFTWQEKYGEPIGRFLQDWINFGISSPETQTALVGTMGASEPKDMLADWYTASAIFIEPDRTHRKVHKSWVGTNLFPQTTGEIVGSRDLQSAKELKEFDVNFGGIFQFNMGTDIFAQTILDQVNYNRANPHYERSFIRDIDSNVQAADRGYFEGIERLVDRNVVT